MPPLFAYPRVLLATALVLGTFFVCATPAKAQSGIGSGITRIAEDTFFETELGFDLRFRDWELAVEIPLRFRLKDLAPPSSSIIREFDYDEVGDYLGWIRYIRYGRTRFWGLAADPYYAKFGELSSVHIGHGSIMNGYDNIIGFNHKQWGVHLRTNQDVATADFLLDDIIDPGVIGARVSIRPGEIFWRQAHAAERVILTPSEAPPARYTPPPVAPTSRRERREQDDDPTLEPSDDNWVVVPEGTVATVEVEAEPTPSEPDTWVAADQEEVLRPAQSTAEPTERRTRSRRRERVDGEVWVGDGLTTESSRDAGDEISIADTDDDGYDHPYPWRGLEFGASVIGDIDAPYRLVGSEYIDEYVTDDRRNILVAETRPTTFIGFDAQIDAYRTDTVSIIPYTDVNTHLRRGRGAHFGSFFNVRTERDVQVSTRIEMRAASQGYEPTYFDTGYEAQRTAFLPINGVLNQPKLRVMDLDGPPSRLGWYADGNVSLGDHVRFSAGIGDYLGPQNSQFFLSLRLRDLGPFDIRFRFSNREFSGAKDILRPQHLQINTRLQWTFLRYFFVAGRFGRDYDVDEVGRYRPDNHWGFGVGLVLPI